MTSLQQAQSARDELERFTEKHNICVQFGALERVNLRSMYEHYIFRVEGTSQQAAIMHPLLLYAGWYANIGVGHDPIKKYGYTRQLGESVEIVLLWSCYKVDADNDIAPQGWPPRPAMDGPQ